MKYEEYATIEWDPNHGAWLWNITTTNYQMEWNCNFVFYKHEQWAILNIWQLMQVVQKWGSNNNNQCSVIWLEHRPSNSSKSSSNKQMLQFYESILKSLGVFTWVDIVLMHSRQKSFKLNRNTYENEATVILITSI